MVNLNHRELMASQAKISSQNGEDGVLLRLIQMIEDFYPLRQTIPHTCFEVGAGLVNGNLECNTAVLLNNGWKGLVVDREEIRHPLCLQSTVTVESINDLIEHVLRVQCGGAETLGVLSIDVDGADYWLWKEVKRQPAIVVVEYNAAIDPRRRLVLPYDPEFKWAGDDYFGASAEALISLAQSKGYVLACAVHQLNLFFVRDDLGRRVYPIDWDALGPIRRHPTRRNPEYVDLDLSDNQQGEGA